jgi:hypothetical protein
VAFYSGTHGQEHLALGANQQAQCIAGYPKARLLSFRVPR